MEIAQQFGIEGKLLLVQFINFAILALVFWKFILPKITDMLDQRKQQIASSLEEARKAQEELSATQDQRAKELAEAKREAETVMKEVRTQAETERQQRITDAKNEADRIIERAREQLAAERTQLRSELRAELAGLAIETTRQVLDQVVTAKERDRLLKSATAKLKRQLPTPKSTKRTAARKAKARGRS